MLQRCYFARYEQLSKMILRYRENPPLKLVKKYETALSELREHLYNNKRPMPLAKYPYDPDDITTHGYIKNPDGLGSIPNPRYKYKDFWKRIDGKRGVR
jgi:hypothetical protein